MTRRPGQALRWIRRLVDVAVALLVVAAAGLGGLAWRLAEGPLEVPPLARRIEAQVNAVLNAALAVGDAGGDAGPRLEIGSAAIAWEGWRGGTRAPLDLRLSGVRLLARDGGSRLELSDAAATLSVRALLRGTLAPATIELRRPVLRVAREADGSFGLELGPAAPADAGATTEPRAAGPTPTGTAPTGTAPASAAEAGTEAGDADLVAVLLDRLADLVQPASDRSGHAALRRLRVTGGEVIMADRTMGRSWSFTEAQIDIRRAATGGLAAEGGAVFRSGAIAVPVRLTGSVAGEPAAAVAAAAGRPPMRLALGIALPALQPPQLAALWPGLAPLAVLDAAVSLSASAEFDAAARPQRLQARLGAGPGTLDLGAGQRLPFAGLEATLEGSGRSLRLTAAQLALPDGPILAATGHAALRDGAWQAALDLRTGAVQAADLPRLWPAGLGGAARQAVLAALPAGLLRDARLRLDLTAPEALDRVALAAARATLGATGAVFDLGQGRRIATDTAEVAASLTPDEIRLDRLAVVLPAPGGTPAGRGPARAATGESRATPNGTPGNASTGNTGGAAAPAGPVITASGEARRQDGLWRGALVLGLDAVRAIDLAGYWPPGIGSGHERAWIIANVTAGTIRNGQWRIEVEAPAALPGGIEALRVTALSGTAEASDATVHWLRPVPPLRGAAATAEFSLDGIVIRARGGRQLNPDGRPDGRASGLELREATVRFLNLNQSPGNAELAVRIGGPLADAVALLRHPRLKLFARRKLELNVAAGQVEARLNIGFPLWNDLPLELLRLRATARIAEARLPGALLDRDLERGAFDLTVDTESLKLAGQGLLSGVPVRLAVELDFRGGPAAQVIERATLTGRPEARQLAALGLDVGTLAEGPLALEARYERRRNGQGQVALRGDLREARLAVGPLRWAKPPGVPGTAEALLRLQGDTLTSLETFRLEAPEVALRGRATFGPRGRLDRLEMDDSRFAGSRFSGEVRRPREADGPWQVALRGPLLDLQGALGPAAAPAPPAAEAATPPLMVELGFERVILGEGRELSALAARLRTDAQGLVREAQATGRSGPPTASSGGFEFTLAPQGAPRGAQRALRLVAEDGGGLLRALDLTRSIEGGRLTVEGTYAELRPGAALTGTAQLDQFTLRDAPAIGKVLQAMTLYGVVEALQGGSGLIFSRLVAPFAMTPEALTLQDARAFSASLGLTAKGRVFRQRPMLDIEGTIVPAYLFNTLLGNIPLLGRLFSPEAGGGLFAATFRVQGPIADPQVSVNPLAVVTPGFLRGLFGLGRGVREVPR